MLHIKNSSLKAQQNVPSTPVSLLRCYADGNDLISFHMKTINKSYCNYIEPVTQIHQQLHRQMPRACYK